MGLTYLGSALLGLILKNLVGRRLLILASQLGMAVSHLGLGLYFHHLTGMRKDDDTGNQTVSGKGNVTVSWSKEGASLGVIGWLPLPLVLGFTVRAIILSNYNIKLYVEYSRWRTTLASEASPGLSRQRFYPSGHPPNKIQHGYKSSCSGPAAGLTPWPTSPQTSAGSW